MNTTQTQSEYEAASSVLVKRQAKTYGPKVYQEDGEMFRITATVRYDDRCGNGHNTFSITGSIDRKVGNRWTDDSGGCIHDEIAKHFPELAPFVKWHLTSSDGPMHYPGNVVFLASERDCWGMLKGEFRQYHSKGQQNGGVSGVPNWVLELPERAARDVYSHTKPEPVTLEWKAYGHTGEGKARELNAARSCAVWPEATDEELCSPDLEAKLIARLPALMAAFKADVESLGFKY